MPTAPCSQCKADISADVIRCPECSYSPVDNGKTGRKLFMVVGSLLTATLIGSVIGLPMILLSWWTGRRKRMAGATGGI